MRIKVMMIREKSKSIGQVFTPKDAYEFLKTKATKLDRECFWRIDLDCRNKVIGWELVSMGTLSASIVHPREVFKGALLSNAASIVIGHNHPSGDPSPSGEDKEVTTRLKQAGSIMGIPLLDHVILANGDFWSFKDHGLL